MLRMLQADEIESIEDAYKVALALKGTMTAGFLSNDLSLGRWKAVACSRLGASEFVDGEGDEQLRFSAAMMVSAEVTVPKEQVAGDKSGDLKRKIGEEIL